VCACVRACVCLQADLDFVGPSEALELPEPHVLRLHPPLPAGRAFLRALPCQHHDGPVRHEEEEDEDEGSHTEGFSYAKMYTF